MKKAKVKKNKYKILHVILTGEFLYLITALALAILTETGKIRIVNQAYWMDLIYFMIITVTLLFFKLKESSMSYIQCMLGTLAIAILSLAITFVTSSQKSIAILHNPVVLLLGGLAGTLAAKAISIKNKKKRM